MSDGLPPPDPFGMILSLFGRDGDTAIVTGAVPNVPSVVQATLAAIGQTQTQVVVIQSKTAMATTQAPTQTLIPTAIFTASPVPTLSSTPTVAPLVYYFPPTATDKPEPEEEPVPTFLPTFTFTPTNTPTNTPTPVPNHLVLYFGAASLGNIGPRSSADALCTANLPSGFSNYHAFLGYSALDRIANMPANYGLPTGLPIQSVTNVVIANNWTDLMDGSISVALNAAGVSPTYNWWSGAEDEFGTHLDGITPDCNDWTSNSGADGGNEGNRSSTTAAWMDVGFGVACNQLIGVLCIAY
ncbi:MAG: hypothetical protein IPO22_07960 [Anaerolineales bacterium]|nr:hypothetical protein [Anaerolineales bacterium]